MEEAGVKANHAVYGALISACEAAGDWRQAVILFEAMEVCLCPSLSPPSPSLGRGCPLLQWPSHGCGRPVARQNGGVADARPRSEPLAEPQPDGCTFALWRSMEPHDST